MPIEDTSSNASLFSSASQESTARLLQVCHALASELKPKLDFVMECTNSHLKFKQGMAGSMTKTVSNSGYNSETESNICAELGTSFYSNVRLGSEPEPGSRLGVDLQSGSIAANTSEDVGENGRKCRKRIPESESIHFRSLRRWEEDLEKGDRAEHGPVLYAMEKMPEKLCGQGT